MKKTIATLVVLTTLGVLAPTIHAAPFTIDEFTQPGAGQAVSVTGVGSAFNTVTGLAGVVGGARTMQITVTTSSYSLSSSANVTASGIGTLSLGNDSGQNGVGMIIWDANGVGLGGVDLTNGGNLFPRLQSKILASDLNLGFSVDITETAAEGGSTASWSTNLGSGAPSVNELLANFTNAANVNFTKVDKIVLRLSGPSAQDATLDLLEVTNTLVPEPAAAVVLMLGGVALAARRRSRKQRI